MRKITAPLAALALLASVPTFAQQGNADVDTQRAADAADREDRGEWGWIGLLGLAGLLGLKRRDHDVSVGRTTGTGSQASNMR